MDISKILVTRNFSNNQTVTRKVYQYDYGLTLIFSDEFHLPSAYEVHFSNKRVGGSTITAIGDSSGVAIPNNLLTSGEDIYAWLYVHQDNSDGETIYEVRIPVRDRSKPDDTPPTPEEESAITKAIAALNKATREIEDKIDELENEPQYELVDELPEDPILTKIYIIREEDTDE